MDPNSTNPFLPPSNAPQPSYADVALQANGRNWGVGAAFGNWLASILFSLIVPIILVVGYAFIFDRQMIQEAMKQRETAPMLLLMLIGTFIAQIFSLILSAFIVTEFWQKPFLPTLGWKWHEKFRLPHAIGLAIGMLVVGVVLEKLLPHQETSLEKFLKFGLPVRIALAVVATIGAPLMEEVIYRGLLFDAIERSAGTRVSLLVVTLLFWGVHVAQYWESIATLAAVLVLSFALTYLRATTKQLLPCVVVHTVFNGIQGILIVLTPPASETAAPQPAFSELIGNVLTLF